MEEYKLVSQIKRNSGITIQYHISNKGNVKIKAYFKDIYLGEEQLSIGHGMYVNRDEILIAVMHTKGQHIYRIIYKLFKGDIPKGYQIHHLDYNHFNNDIDNLICVTAYEHGKLHKLSNTFIYGYIPTNDSDDHILYTSWLNYNILKDKLNKSPYKNKEAKEDIFNIYKKFEEQSKIIRNELNNERLKQSRQKQLEIKKQIEEDKQRKLDSGEYIINKSGKLSKKHTPKWTDERREKTMKTRKEVYKSETFRQHVSEGVRRYNMNKNNNIIHDL